MKKEFRNFQTSKLFDIHPTKAYKLNNSDLYKEIGSTPVLSNSSINNGIGGFSALNATEKGSIITFSDTTTGADTMFFQPNAFIGYPHVQGLYPYDKESWNENQCLYFISVMKNACGTGWDYSNKFTRVFVLSTTPLLPIKTDNENNPIIDETCFYHEQGFIPDFDYMQEYIEEIKHKRMLELEQYLIKDDLNEYNITEKKQEFLKNTDDVIYKNFMIVDVFDIKNSHNILKTDVIFNSGTTPYVTASSENNGVMGYISYDENMIEKGNVIFIGGKSMTIFYQDKDFFSNDSHNLILTLKDANFRNENVQLFLVTALYKSLSYKYVWNDSISYKKIQTDIVNLPILSNNGTPAIDKNHKYHKDGYIPDFEYMEKYIKIMQKKVIADVVKYKNEVIAKI